MSKDANTWFSEIRITGALNAEIYGTMTVEEVRDFIVKDCEERARKFVSEEWTKQVGINAEYLVIDCRYNVQRTLSARLVFTHEAGAELNGELVITNS